METTRSKHTLHADAGFLGAFASVLLLIHFLLGDGYGFHRDELQFLDDARHLQWGFVAYPPLTAFCGRVAIALFGMSPQVLRLPAAVANAISLVLVGLTARELGGSRVAQAMALFAMLPVGLAFSSVLQYNTFDLLAWCLVLFFTARVLRTGDERSWVGAGVGVGIGVLSKYSIGLLAVSVVAAMAMLPSQRKAFRSRWFWYGAAAAAAIAAPNLIWLASHHFITLKMESFIHARDVRHGRADGYYTDQIKFTMLGLPLAIAGLVSLLRSGRFRLLSAFYIGPFVLFAILRGRGYYLLPAYPALYAAGAVALERVVSGRAKWVRVAVPAVALAGMLADTAALAWAYLPMWRIGSAGWNWQMKNNSDMADEVGWPEFVAQVAAVRDTLPPQEREHYAVLANNYGEAGALALYGPRYGLPVPISSTNTFHMRGYGVPQETVIVVGDDLPDQLLNFESCVIAAYVQIPYGVMNEENRDHPQMLICHHLRRPWAEVWSRSQEYG